MKYLLDTNVIVDHLRGKKALEPFFIEQGSAISVITQAELIYGACKSDKTQANLRKISSFLTDLGVETISLKEDILKKYGGTKVVLEKKGQKLDEFDLLIAATALSLKLKLVTQNIKHFARISKLKIEDY